MVQGSCTIEKITTAVKKHSNKGNLSSENVKPFNMMIFDYLYFILKSVLLSFNIIIQQWRTNNKYLSLKKILIGLIKRGL